MKKLIGVILALLLFAGGLGGVVYAQGTHEPMVGQKLVGSEACGKATGILFYTMFILTNPDCVSQITVDRVSVIGADGTVIYEGTPFIITAQRAW